MTPSEHLAELGACREAKEWIAQYSDFRAAWLACPRADWLIWYTCKTRGYASVKPVVDRAVTRAQQYVGYDDVARVVAAYAAYAADADASYNAVLVASYVAYAAAYADDVYYAVDDRVAAAGREKKQQLADCRELLEYVQP
jgi:hypothetical protein